MENKATCILVGGGKSICDGLALGLWDKIKGKEVWSLNFAYKVMPYLPHREVFVDTLFFNNNSKILPELARQGVKIYAKAHTRYAIIKEVKQYFVTRNKKDYLGTKALEKNLLYIGRMGMVGHFALSLAIAEQYKNIYLLGYDFGVVNYSDTFTHFYQKDIQVISAGVGAPEVYWKNGQELKGELEDYSVYTKDLDKCNIWNVSPNSNIPYFDKITYEEFFKKLENNE